MLFVFLPAHIRPSELYVVAARCQENAAHFCSVWGLPPPAIEVFQSARALPDFCAPVLFVDEMTDASGVLAYHEWDAVRHMPAARVFVNKASGLLDGDFSVSEAASHEVLEALADPVCDRWEPLAGRPGVEVAYEVCDPVQDEYLIESARVSNFVTPQYFSSELDDPVACKAYLDAGGTFDWNRTLARPGQIGPSGYLILRDATHRWTEGPRGEEARAKPGAKHPLARTERRLAG